MNPITLLIRKRDYTCLFVCLFVFFLCFFLNNSNILLYKYYRSLYIYCVIVIMLHFAYITHVIFIIYHCKHNYVNH